MIRLKCCSAAAEQRCASQRIRKHNRLSNLAKMHEMSLCESILQTLEQQALEQNYSRVKTVWLELGALAGVEVEALRFSFGLVIKGSLADGASLEIIEVPGQAWCLPCGREVAVAQLYDQCPHCGSHQLQVTDGNQMRIKELEVE